MKTKTLIAGIVLAALLVTVSSVSAATIWTDKEDYQPEEIVYISGSGFTPGAELSYIKITRPDGTVDVCPCANCSKEFESIDFDGNFSDYEYDLDGVEGLYTVDVSDEEGITAQTTFTDFVRPLTYSDSGHSNAAYMFKDGETVYAEIALGLPSKFLWKNESGITVRTSSCYYGGGPYQDSYLLSGANTGTWTVTRLVYTRRSGCIGSVIGKSKTRFNVYEGQRIRPDDDSYIRKCGNLDMGAAATTTHDDANIHAKWENNYLTCPKDNRLDKRRAYFKFDLSGIHDTETITSAKLHLYRYAGRAKQENVGVYNVSSDDWTEGKITWRNAPGMGSELDNTNVGLNSNQDGGYIWDVTSAAQSEFVNDKTLSLGLKFTDESTRKHQDFCDRELSGCLPLYCPCQDDLYPYLEIVCEGEQPIPEFATIALPAVSILGLFLFFNHRKRREE